MLDSCLGCDLCQPTGPKLVKTPAPPHRPTVAELMDRAGLDRTVDFDERVRWVLIGYINMLERA